MTLSQLSQNHADALSAESAVRERIRKDYKSLSVLIKKRKSAKRVLDAAKETYHEVAEPRASEEFAASGFKQIREAITK